jgi:hypothetical protein
MNQVRLTKWIEKAEERAICDLARAEPGLLKLGVDAPCRHRSVELLHAYDFMSRVTHSFAKRERPPRRAA